MRLIVLISALLFCSFLKGQEPLSLQDKKTIITIMDGQENCWNMGDLECFMEGYWKSDSLKFIGKNGLKYGWQSTLDNYKTSYPDKATMGLLRFEIISIEALGAANVLVIGKWHLTRVKGDIGGHFSLIWAKKKGEWVIVVDHSS